jgi:hypothetical protein
MNDLIVPAPEWLEVANTYLHKGTIQATAAELGLPAHTVTEIIARKDVQGYLTQIYMDLGYRNRNKIAEVMDLIIDEKLKEAAETGIYSSKDLAELLMMAHKIRMEEIKAIPQPDKPTQQTNVQINDMGGNPSGYAAILEKLWKSQG